MDHIQQSQLSPAASLYDECLASSGHYTHPLSKVNEKQLQKLVTSTAFRQGVIHILDVIRNIDDQYSVYDDLSDSLTVTPRILKHASHHTPAHLLRRHEYHTLGNHKLNDLLDLPLLGVTQISDPSLALSITNHPRPLIEYPNPTINSTTPAEPNKLHAINGSHVLLAADAALQHIIRHRERIKHVLSCHEILESDYYIQTGFNERLLKRGIGYLQEIYVFLRVEPLTVRHLSDGLGRVFTPYPGAIITPSASHRTHVFKDDMPCSRDTVVLERTEGYSGSNFPSPSVMQSIHREFSRASSAQASGDSNGGGGGDDNDDDDDDDNNGSNERQGDKGSDKDNSGADQNHRIPDEKDHKQGTGGTGGSEKEAASRLTPDAWFDFRVHLSDTAESSPQVYQTLVITGAVTLSKVSQT